MRRDIVKLPDERLRLAATPVIDVEPFGPVVDDLFDTCADPQQKTPDGANLIALGLSAPQIGVMKRIAVVKAYGIDVVLVNPSVYKVGKKSDAFPEECFSCPGVKRWLERPTEVYINGVWVKMFKRENLKDREKCVLVHGHRYKLMDKPVKLVGMPARIALHEIDHLDGILILDKAIAKGYERVQALEDKGMGKATETGTWWNGEPCKARKVKVIVADAPEFEGYWAREFVGQERAAVEVTQDGQTFYIDDADGSGWLKVTNGMGSPRYGHGSLTIERVVEDEDVRAAAQ